jgi:hypothetical protein
MIRDEFGGRSDDDTHADGAGRFKSFPIANDQTTKVVYVGSQYQKA